ncbi:MAG: hypothetical protein IPL35_01995 [Sphingobacteriales bacterium]|nr:hypothetical protein [Sphingobacteriales bacterium]
MNRLQIAILLALTISTIACGQTKIPPSENQSEKATDWFSIMENKYAIKYPSNWEVNKSGQMGTSFILFSPLSNESDKFKENVNLLIQDLTGYDLNLDQYVEISEGQIKTMLTEGQIISSERKKKDKQEYQKVIYTGKQGIYDLKFEQYYWVIDNQAFVLTLTGEKEEFDKYQDIGEKILNSFEIKYIQDR